MARKIVPIVAVSLFAAALAAAAYVAAGSPKMPMGIGEIALALTGQGGIRPGFVGTEAFGAWRLICVQAPVAAIQPIAEAAENRVLGPASACRLNQEVSAQDEPGRVVLAANFSTVGPNAIPALMLRLPGTLRGGDPILLRIGENTILRTSVRDCAGAECVAAGDLSEEEWSQIIAASDLQVTFPMKDGKLVYVKLAVDGLVDAAAALAATRGGGS